jgi:hypothetical protein
MLTVWVVEEGIPEILKNEAAALFCGMWSQFAVGFAAPGRRPSPWRRCQPACLPAVGCSLCKRRGCPHNAVTSVRSLILCPFDLSFLCHRGTMGHLAITKAIDHGKIYGHPARSRIRRGTVSPLSSWDRRTNASFYVYAITFFVCHKVAHERKTL